jgi:hypothetical protein
MTRIAAFALALAAGHTGWAQSALSARSGMIHHLEGDATLAGERITVAPGRFPEVREGATLRTGRGRAEVLLNPGVFLRLDENSEFQMISNRLDDTYVTILHGGALVEVVEVAKHNKITVRVGEARIQPLKHGLYHIDADARELRVFDGKALASLGGASMKLGRGRVAQLDPALQVAKFNRKTTGYLHAWSRNRSALIAQANMNSSLSAARSGVRRRGVSAWSWYPALGVFTFIPASGRVYSPFGYYYYSPVYVWQAINPVRVDPYYGSAASAGAWAGRPASSSPSVSAAEAASTGNISRSEPVSAPAAPVEGGPRDRGR